MALRDIRDLQQDKDACAAELERRWTGLLSYRYIGKRVGSMDVGEGIDNTVKVRHDFRNSTGETAAMDHAKDLAGTGRLHVESSHEMFLARGKIGPFRVDGKAHLGADGKIGVRTIITDEGAERSVTSASHVFRIVP